MKVTIRIREVISGKEVDYDTRVEERYLDSQRFYYEDGNGSCDCNRKLMFGYAQGIEFSDEETPCGNKQYKIRVTIENEVILNELERD